ncbi:MAG: shikimate kinase [Ruminococcus sp.]|jgi:shikimate kinase|nr:shikimate kinase [Ruminococcus sp.]
MYTIFLSGFMASGKTTAAKTFARMTGAEHIDLDEYIEKKLGATVSEIFAERGEEVFRKTEADCLRELCGRNAIVSLGGGTMTDGKNYGAVRLSGGFVVFINTPYNLCERRIRREQGVRPIADALNDTELEKLYNSRLALYKKNCDAEVTGENPSLLIMADIMEAVAGLIDRLTDKESEEVLAEFPEGNPDTDTEEET